MNLSGAARLPYFILLSAALWLPGLAQAQSPVTCQSPGAAAIPIRNEGITEQVADYTFTCTNASSAQVHLLVTATMSAPVTSIVESSPYTEATVYGPVNIDPGTASGNTVTFSNPVVGGPGTFSFTITNIRIDAGSLASGAAVTETVSITGTGVNTANFSAVQVATVYNGITSVMSSVNNYGAGASLTGSASTFGIQFGETANVPAAFKTQGGAGNSTLGSEFTNNTETGYYTTAGGGTNIANGGTRIRVLLSNIPSGMSLYVPINISTNQTITTNLGTFPLGTAAATSGESTAFSQLTAASPQPSGYTGAAPLAQITVNANATAEVVYEIMADASGTAESYTVPFYIVGPVPSNAQNVSATVSFAPVSVAANVPDFNQLPGSSPTLNASQFSLTNNSYTAPMGEVGVSYTASYSASGGTAPYTFAFVTGSAPPGLTLNASTGAITGMPTTAGSYNFTLGVTDATNAFTSLGYTIQINPHISITTGSSYPNGALTEVYPVAPSISASSGIPSYTFNVSSGSFPPGMFLSPLTSVSAYFGGTPTSAGTYNFNITVTDAVGATSIGAFSLTINAALGISTTSANIPVGVQGLAYIGAQATGTAGSGGYSYAIATNAQLTALTNAGMTFNSTGQLEGTPNTTGAINFQIMVTDLGGATATSPTLTLSLNPQISFTTTSVPNGTVNAAYTTQVAVTGGSGQYTNWLVTSGTLPPGLALSQSGVISGTPTAAGSYPFQIRIQDGVYSNFVTMQYTIVISGPLSITTSTLPNAVTQLNYNQTLTASGGSGGYTWSLTAGALPTGLTLNASTGAITGIPPFGGDPFGSVTVQVTDSNGSTATANLSITANPSPVNFYVLNQQTGGLIRQAADASSFAQFAPLVGGYGIALDNSGNYIVATLAQLQRVTPSGSATILSYAPSGSQFDAVAVDAVGNLIVGDNAGHQVFRFSPDGQTRTQVAAYSVANPSLTEDLSLLVDVHGNYIVAEDNGSVSLFSITPSGTVTHITLTGSALPSKVGGLTFDQNGNYMLQDPQQQVLYHITPQGAVTQFALNDFSTVGLARNPLDSSYVLNANGQLRYLPPNGSESTPIVDNEIFQVEGIIAQTTDFVSSVIASNPLGYFRFEARSASSEVNGYTYTASGGTAVQMPGAPITTPGNQDIKFDGSTGQVTTSLSGGITNAASVMAWVNLNELPSSSSEPFFYIAGESQVGNDFDLQFSNANILSFFTTSNGASLSYTPLQSSLIGQWHFIVATFDATAGKRAIYWDGQLVASDTVVSTQNKTTPFNIGSTNVFPGRNFSGQIDEVAVWNYALTAGQVYYLYESAGGISVSPSLTTLSPATAPVNGGSTPVTINGAGLGTTSYVLFASPSGTTTAIAPTSATTVQVQATVPASILTTSGIAQITVTNSLGFPTNQLPFTIGLQALTITPSTLPAGIAGQSYSPVTFTASGGSGSYTWVATGLPSGLTINASTGVISGTPSTAASYFVTITGTDTMTGQAGTLMNVSLLIQIPSSPPPPPPPSLTFTGGALPGATADQPYSARVAASGGTPPYAYSASGLPSGFAITASTGVINGTTTQSGMFTVSIHVSDSQSNSGNAAFSLTVASPPAPPPLQLSGSLPQGSAGSPYSAGFSASGGEPPYTFSDSGFPPGIGINANNGSVSGQTAQTGSFTVTISVTDSTSTTTSGSFTLTIEPPPPVALSGGDLGSVVLGTPVSTVIRASGGVPPFAYAVAGGARPPGLNLLSSGTLRGTPLKAGAYSFTVKGTDSTGASASGVFTMTILAPPLTINVPSTLAPAVATVPYPTQTLSITGGTAPYTFSVSQGSLPVGLTLSSTGMITGTPTGAASSGSSSRAMITKADTTSGGSSFTVTASDSSTPPATGSATFSIAVQPFSQNVVLSAGSLSFSLPTGTAVLPVSQNVGVQTTMVSQSANYTVAVQPASATWLSATTGGASTPGAISVGLTQAALALAASATPYTANVVVTCISGGCSGTAQSVSVSLTVSSPPPVLSVQDTVLSFNTTSAAPQATTESLAISNTGGGGIGFASIACGAPWCTVSGAPSSLLAGVSATLTITADPTGLAAGYYYTSVSIVSSAGSASVPVTFAIAPNGVISLGPAGTEFNLPQGGLLGQNNSFLVGITGTTPVSYSAAVQPGAPWLRVIDGSGMASGPSPGRVTYGFNESALQTLTPGPYYGTILIVAGGASNSPQSFEVVLNVTAPTFPVTPSPSPGGLVFLTQATATPPAQTVTVYSFSTDPTGFQAAASTMKGGDWLSVTPETGSTTGNAAASVSVSANPAGLKPGVYEGAVNFAFSAEAVRSVNVTLVVENTGAATNSAISPKDATSGCTPSQLVPTSTGLVSNFAAPAAWPVPLAITLVDDCGNLINNGQVVAMFSNGDPPLILALADPTMASYVATWTPEHAAGQITINARATAPSFTAAIAQIGGAVTPNDAPILADLAIANFYNPIGGAPLAPGSLVQITGQYLSGQTMNAPSIPLPLTLGGTSVIIGGMQAPLSMVSPGQVNAQVPFELPAGQPYQVIINANNALTTPQSFQAGAASPGLAVLPSGYLEAGHTSGALVTEAAPAAPGETISVYLVGMGATTIPVASGEPGPSGTFATTVINPVLTLNGENTTVSFSGLIPGLVGVYQVNFQVPSVAPNGDLTLSLVENAFTSNSGLLPVHN